ncbi:hypothetical protein PSJE_24255 [Pseudomonas jessenii]|nr:hypothetical protein PSJE_24255 [Pseudomonas jessenii]
MNLWRGGLPPLGCEAALNPEDAVFLYKYFRRDYDGFAADRGQAPSPQTLPYPISTAINDYANSSRSIATNASRAGCTPAFSCQ